jgi:hypothetical protein
MLHRSPDVTRCGKQRHLTLVDGRIRGEEVEVGSLPVPEIIADQGGASR